jgi:hypothetical protein
MGDTRFCLHGGYSDGPRYRTAHPLAVHFEVEDVHEAVDRINRYGGRLQSSVVDEDNRPAELRKVRQRRRSELQLAAQRQVAERPEYALLRSAGRTADSTDE